MKERKLLAGVLIGVAAGTLMGILFAPEKGIKTRKRIAKKGTGFSDYIKNKFNSIADATEEEYEDVKEQSKELVKKGKVATQNIKS